MSFVEYVKQVWKAGRSGGTPWSPDRLNHMEDGIKSCSDGISELNSNIAYTPLYGTSDTIKNLYNSMPDGTIKFWNIQASPDNPFSGLICYCEVYRINSQWGSIFMYNQYGSKKTKIMSNGELTDWE